MNDIGLLFGGRFDVGQVIDNKLHECNSANEARCWGYSHLEHRGSEADIRLIDRSSASRTRAFDRLVRRHFASVYVHGSHWHVRDAFSPYGR